ncbi:hypothetical protein [Kutzneria chonburiensis]|uniref:Uncharacterized protein n=1 Tax=Kutzneria chonburiensis TaxID=1483604 RepID=A0ABV6MNT2_9PSEU|nr:hypothetical protein [Kutzneria chonburiensis]
MSLHMDNIEVLDDEVVVEDETRHTRVVKVDNRDSGDTIRLLVPVNKRLAVVIDIMYTEFGVDRQPDDRLTCRQNGQDVFQFADETLERYIEQGHCPGLHWSFVGDTGGA